MKSPLFLHRDSPPFAPIRELRTATNIDRVKPLDTPGTMNFQLSSAEALGGLVKVGSAVVDRSDQGIEPWLWFVSRIAYDVESGMADVECWEWRQMLYRRTVPLSEVASARAAWSAAVQLLRTSGGRLPTHLRPHFGDLSGLRYIMPEQSQALGGMSLGDAFDLLAAQTVTEWWVDYHVNWREIQPTLHWAAKRGLDRRYQVVLEEGYHMTAGSYTLDLADTGLQQEVVGAGDDIATRPAAATAVGRAAVTMRPVATGRMIEATETERRKSLASTGPAIASQGFSVSSTVDADQTLIGASVDRLEVPVTSLQAVEVTLGGAADWSAIQLGDRLRVRLSSARFGTGVAITARVLALQPDEASGEMLLALEVQG